MKKRFGRRQIMVLAYVCGVLWLVLTCGVQMFARLPIVTICAATVFAVGSTAFVWGFLYPCGNIGGRLRHFGFRWLGIFTYAFPFLCLAFFFVLLCPWEHIFAVSYGGAVCFAASLLVWGRVQAQRVVVRTETIVSEKLAAPFTAAVLSDLHFEMQKDYRRLAKAVEKLNGELVPDVVFFCGDVFYDRVLTGAPAARLQEILRGIRAPYGVYACLGNHDSDTPNDPVYEKVAAFLAGAGVTLLDDKSAVLPCGVVYGRKDKYLKNRLSAAELLAGHEAFTIVLDHQPSDLSAIAAAGADLILCGHTHRGQLIPMPIFHMCDLFYGRGKFGAATALVTCGFGWYGPPLRLGSTGEMVMVRLVPYEKT